MPAIDYRIKRIYDPPAADDGFRVLVDRLWPRGLSKADARVDHWARDVSPSNELRKWYGHDPNKWDEFRRRYAAELRQNTAALDDLRSRLIGHDTVTLLFGSRELELNNAQALKQLLEQGVETS